MIGNELMNFINDGENSSDDIKMLQEKRDGFADGWQWHLSNK